MTLQVYVSTVGKRAFLGYREIFTFFIEELKSDYHPIVKLYDSKEQLDW